MKNNENKLELISSESRWFHFFTAYPFGFSYDDWTHSLYLSPNPILNLYQLSHF